LLISKGVKEMNTELTEQQSLYISQKKLLAIVHAMIGGSRGREDDEHPLPPGPWDPIIRAALERITVFEPDPSPWRSKESIFLNPQPIPPGIAFLVSLVQTVINRAELLQEIADITRHEGEKQSIIIVGGRYLERFVEDICGNDFRFKFPFPSPPPKWWPKEISGIDLVVMAAQFDQAANETYNLELQQNLVDASDKLAEVGMSKMQQ